MFKIFCTYICWIIYKMQHLEVSGAVRHIYIYMCVYIYIYVVRQLRVKFTSVPCESYIFFNVSPNILCNFHEESKHMLSEEWVLLIVVHVYFTYRGADKSLSWPDWKSNRKVAIFCPTWRPGWMDNLQNFFFEWLAKVGVWSCSLFPSWWG